MIILLELIEALDPYLFHLIFPYLEMTKHGQLGYYCKMLNSVVHNNFHQTFWLAPSDQKPALKDNPPKIATPLSNISVHVVKTKRVRLITSNWH